MIIRFNKWHDIKPQTYFRILSDIAVKELGFLISSQPGLLYLYSPIIFKLTTDCIR
jgi:hypothetical protein